MPDKRQYRRFHARIQGVGDVAPAFIIFPLAAGSRMGTIRSLGLRQSRPDFGLPESRGAPHLTVSLMEQRQINGVEKTQTGCSFPT